MLFTFSSVFFYISAVFFYINAVFIIGDLSSGPFSSYLFSTGQLGACIAAVFCTAIAKHLYN